MKGYPPGRLGLALLVQKLAEFVFLSAELAVAIYVDARILADPLPASSIITSDRTF